ncbi:MAG: SRPBCC family protein [Pseudomonadota bacterium]
MDRTTSIELLRELIDLKGSGSAFLDDKPTRSPADRYGDLQFQRERERIFRRHPLVAAHASELAEPNSFLTRSIADLPVLLTRDKTGQVRAFLNVCRHRGARLVHEERGCRSAFSCPYHAWTYRNTGQLRAIPHEKQGFPGIDKASRGLRELPVAERLGFIWIVGTPGADGRFDENFAALEDELAWLDLENHGIAATADLDCAANWKLLVEGGIEAYHFKVTHRNTIGPHFMDNLSSYRAFGRHLRSILPRESVAGLAEAPEAEWDIRTHANVLYSLFPNTQLLVMQDHIAWIWMTPVSAAQTRLRIATLAPASEINAGQAEHWERNQAITMTTLAEDFTIGESIQAGLSSGANEDLLFGRFEGALETFNGLVDAALAEDPA